jgi:mycothiol synthase
MHELSVIWDHEDLPDDPPTPLAQRIADWRHVRETDSMPRWIIREDGLAVATAWAYMDLAQNLDNGYGWVFVHPDHRGRGLAREIAPYLLDRLEQDGRFRFGTEIRDRAPEEPLMQRAGLKSVLREKRSRLPFQQVDWNLMETWVKNAEDRASDYELMFTTSPLPEEHIEGFCRLVDVMNTAPLDDLIEEDQRLTPAMLRDQERKQVARRQQSLLYVAVHRPTGQFAGFSNVVYSEHEPDLVWQEDTGVEPAHRNRGLGRWLKAAMAIELRDRYPEVQRIDTHNAGSNKPMLSINIEMGFRPILIENVWQGDLATLRRNLAV